MEGKVTTSRCIRFAVIVLWALALSGVGAVFVRDLRAQSAEEEGGQISLQRAVTARDYNGNSVEGQEWAVGQGDSLWRILIQERGLAEKRFGQYLTLIRRLNPQMKTADVLRVGDKVFIPLRPDELLGNQTPPAKTEVTQPGKGATRDYTVKQGDSLLRVLKEQLSVADEKKLNLYFNLTRDLNPQKKNWDILLAGETIRLPALGTAAEVSSQASGPTAKEKSDSVASGQPVPVADPERKPVAEIRAAVPPSMGLDYARRLPARENLALLGQAVETVGNEIQRSGQEVIAITNGAIRIDTGTFPMVYNRKLGQRILLDADEKIPDSLRNQLNDRASGTPVMTVSKNTSAQEAVSQLLARLGFQSLPTEKAVILQEDGVAFEAKGQWVVLAPQESNKPQEVYVINLTNQDGEVPEYLRYHLGLKGLHLREILWPPSAARRALVVLDQPREGTPQAKTLPRDKGEIVDALLLAYGIPFGVRQTLSVELREGLKIETQCDRVFEWRGQQTALFFQRVEPDIKKALQEKQGIKTIEVDLASASSRDLIGKLLGELGDPAAYREHRFPAASGMMQDRLVVVASGFLLPKRSTFVTDREIPQEFHRFFFEKGLEIVYFQ